MVSRPPTLKKLIKGIYYGYAMYSVEVSLSDTITVSQFSALDNIKFAALIDMADGTEIACTFAALNVITVSGASTNDKCALFVLGRIA